MRILFVVHSAKLGGAQQVALGQAAALAGEHELLIAVGHGPLRPRFAALGTLLRAPTRLPIWGASPARWVLDAARALPDAIRLAWTARRGGCHVIVGNSTVLVAPVMAGRLARVPVLIHAQEAPKSAAARRLFAFQGRFADTVVAISPWIADAFTGARATVLENPVGIELGPRPRRGPRDPSRPLRILVVGTLDEHKRQDLAIAALPALSEAGVSAELALVGPEADLLYGARLRELAGSLGVEDAVAFVGPSEDVGGRMRDSDVVVVPAGEVTPLVLMEAMALGVPVVAARMGSIPTVVVHEVSGLLAEPGNASALAQAIGRIAGDPGLADRLAAGGRARVEARYDQRGSHRRLAEELRRLADRTPLADPVAAPGPRAVETR